MTKARLRMTRWFKNLLFTQTLALSVGSYRKCKTDQLLGENSVHILQRIFGFAAELESCSD